MPCGKVLSLLIDGFSERVLHFWNWRATSCIFSGALLTLAFAPFHLIVVLPISFLLLLYLIEINTVFGLKRVFVIGFLWGFGHFFSSLYWIANALLVEPEKFAWFVPCSLLLIPACMALFIGIFALIMAFMLKVSRVATCFGFASGWIIVEVVRSYAILEFPWNLIGYTSAFSPYLMQIISVFGINGAGFIIVLTAVVFYGRNMALTIVVLLLFCSCFLYGYYRIDSSDNGSHAILKVRLVQPNFQEFHFGNLEKQRRFLDTLVEMSNSSGYEDRDLIIWAESAFPFVVAENASKDFHVLRKLLKGGALLAFGADSYSVSEGDGAKGVLHNSLFFIDSSGEEKARYDKRILVPFGEYIPMPLKKTLSFLSLGNIVGGDLEFSSGTQSDSIIHVDGLGDIAVMICFESIFEALYNNEISQNVSFVLNITNDLWFGNSIGPYQHFTMSRMRAIEYGSPLMRVANNGMSAVIDRYGRVLSFYKLNSQVVSDIDLKVGCVGSVYVGCRLKCVMAFFLLSVFFISALWCLGGRRRFGQDAE